MRLFWFERVRTFIIVSVGNDCLLHANIASLSSLFIFNEHLIYDIFFSPILLRLKGMKTAQMFRDIPAWDQVKVQFN